MSTIQRFNSTSSTISNTSKSIKATHCIIQHSNAEKKKEIVSLDKILNSSNRRLKVGDDGTLKGDGRHHVRVKILCLSKLNKSNCIYIRFYSFYSCEGDLETCQHQMNIIGGTRINDSMSIDSIENFIIVSYLQSDLESVNTSSANQSIDDTVSNHGVKNKKKSFNTEGNTIQFQIIEYTYIQLCIMGYLFFINIGIKSTSSKLSQSQTKLKKISTDVHGSTRSTNVVHHTSNKSTMSKQQEISNIFINIVYTFLY